MVTVASSFFATPAMNVRKGPIVPAAMFSSKALTTSSAVTAVPSENVAPSRKVISYSVSDTGVGSPAARAG